MVQGQGSKKLRWTEELQTRKLTWLATEQAVRLQEASDETLNMPTLTGVDYSEIAGELTYKWNFPSQNVTFSALENPDPPVSHFWRDPGVPLF